MAEQKPNPVRLRTIADLQEAHEFLFNAQRAGQLDGKAVDGMNTTLKGSVYLNVKLPMDALKLYVIARKAKIEVTSKMLPAGMEGFG